MQTKHFIDDPTHLVNTALHSLTITNPSIAVDAANKIVYRRPTKELVENPKVSIITGGGSGHEPAFAGFVGKGFVTAAVAGTIFASPSAEQVRRAALTRVPTAKGVAIVTFNVSFGLSPIVYSALPFATKSIPSSGEIPTCVGRPLSAHNPPIVQG